MQGCSSGGRRRGRQHRAAEVASQPALLAAGGARWPPDVAGPACRRPASGSRWPGCGTSWFIAQAYAAAGEAAGQGETDAFAASEMPPGRALRPGRWCCPGPAPPPRSCSCWTGCAAACPPWRSPPTPGTPVAAAADAVIALDFADEQSVVQTRFATTELALLRAHLGAGHRARWPTAAERVLAEPLPGELLAARQFTFLGTGWTYGLANEAALKLREAAGMWTEAYPAMEYRHGPDRGDRPGQRGLAARRRRRTGSRGEVAAAGGPAWASREDPLAELVRVHRLAVALARAARAGPGPAAEPDPLGHPATPAEVPAAVMIGVVCAQPGAGRHPRRRPGVDWAGVNRPDAVHARPGGKGLNVARTLRALGRRTCWCIGPGRRCHRRGGARPALAGAGRAGRFTPIAGETRRTFAVVGHARRGARRAVQRAGTAGDGAASTRAFLRSVSRRRWPAARRWCCPAACRRGLPAGAYAELIARAAAARGAGGAGRARGRRCGWGRGRGPGDRQAEPGRAGRRWPGGALPAAGGPDLAAGGGRRGAAAAPGRGRGRGLARRRRAARRHRRRALARRGRPARWPATRPAPATRWSAGAGARAGAAASPGPSGCGTRSRSARAAAAAPVAGRVRARRTTTRLLAGSTRSTRADGGGADARSPAWPRSSGRPGAAGRGVGAFNVIGIEHAEAIVAGAEAAGAPVVLQISENCVRYHGALAPIALAALAIAGAAAVPVAVHLDHATGEDLVERGGRARASAR